MQPTGSCPATPASRPLLLGPLGTATLLCLLFPALPPGVGAAQQEGAGAGVLKLHVVEGICAVCAAGERVGYPHCGRKAACNAGGHVAGKGGGSAYVTE